MKKLLLLLAFGLWTVDCGLSQTPFTLSVRDATSSPYNLTAVFTPQTIYGYTFSNAIYGAGITNAANAGIITNSLLEGPYTITFVGNSKSLHVYVPGLWVTNIAGQTLPVNLADPRWQMTAFQFIFVQTNTIAAVQANYTNVFNVTNTVNLTNNLSGTNLVFLPTNAPGILVTPTGVFISTNYDAPGAAAAVATALANTNTLTHGDIATTNAATVAAMQATNTLAHGDIATTNAATVSAMQATNTLTHGDIATTNAATLAAMQATNTLTHGDIATTNAATLAAMQATNTLAHGDIATTNAATVAAMQATNTLTHGDIATTNAVLYATVTNLVNVTSNSLQTQITGGYVTTGQLVAGTNFVATNSLSQLLATNTLAHGDIATTNAAAMAAMQATNTLAHGDIATTNAATVAAMQATNTLTHGDIATTNAATVAAMQATNTLTHGDIASTNAATVAALAATNTILNFRAAWLQSQIGNNTNFIIVSSAANASANNTNTYAGNGSWTNVFGAAGLTFVTNAPTGARIFVSGIDLAGSVGGYAAGSAWTNDSGSGSTPVTIFMPASLAAGANITLSSSLNQIVVTGAAGGTGQTNTSIVVPGAGATVVSNGAAGVSSFTVTVQPQTNATLNNLGLTGAITNYNPAAITLTNFNNVVNGAFDGTFKVPSESWFAIDSNGELKFTTITNWNNTFIVDVNGNATAASFSDFGLGTDTFTNTVIATNSANQIGGAAATFTALNAGNSFQIGSNKMLVTTPTVVGMSNWSGVNIGGNGSYFQTSATTWLNTNTPIYSLLTNGTVWAALSNSLTIATAPGPNGPWTTNTSAGINTTPISWVGAFVQENGLRHIGQGNFDSLNAGGYPVITQSPAGTNLIQNVAGATTAFATSAGVTTILNPVEIQRGTNRIYYQSLAATATILTNQDTIILSKGTNILTTPIDLPDGVSIKGSGAGLSYVFYNTNAFFVHDNHAFRSFTIVGTNAFVGLGNTLASAFLFDPINRTQVDSSLTMTNDSWDGVDGYGGAHFIQQNAAASPLTSLTFCSVKNGNLSSTERTIYLSVENSNSVAVMDHLVANSVFNTNVQNTIVTISLGGGSNYVLNSDISADAQNATNPVEYIAIFQGGGGRLFLKNTQVHRLNGSMEGLLIEGVGTDENATTAYVDSSIPFSEWTYNAGASEVRFVPTGQDGSKLSSADLNLKTSSGTVITNYGPCAIPVTLSALTFTAYTNNANTFSNYFVGGGYNFKFASLFHGFTNNIGLTNSLFGVGATLFATHGLVVTNFGGDDYIVCSNTAEFLMITNMATMNGFRAGICGFAAGSIDLIGASTLSFSTNQGVAYGTAFGGGTLGFWPTLPGTQNNVLIRFKGGASNQAALNYLWIMSATNGQHGCTIVWP